MTAESVQFLFLDIQPEIVAGSKTNPPESVTRAAVALAKIGKLLKAPMFLSVVPIGQGTPQMVPALTQELQGIPQPVRSTVDVFADKSTSDAMKQSGRHDLVVCGVITEAAVLMAAYSAVSQGFEVHIPLDACGGMSPRTEDAAIRQIESFDANTLSVATLVAMLTPDLTSELGRQMMQILMTLEPH